MAPTSNPGLDATGDPGRAGAATHVLAIRHGQSTWNAQGRWQGQLEAPLSDLGRAQAVAAARVLADDCPPFDTVITSDLSRAASTAAILAEHLGIETVTADPRLRETYAGPWQGLTRDEIEAGWPGWLAEGRWPQDFEDFADVAERFFAAARSAAAAHPGAHILFVCHGGIIRAARSTLAQPDFRLPNLGAAWFRVESDGSVRAGAVLLPLEPKEGDIVE